MPERRRLRTLAAVVAIGVVVAVVWSGDDGHNPLFARGPEAAPSSAPIRTVGAELADAIARARARAAIPFAFGRGDGTVVIRGVVTERTTSSPAADIEVVFRGAQGESTTTTGADGSYAIDVVPGVYRAFVRSDRVMSIGHADRVRLPGAPQAETANAPDEALMPLVVASADVDHVDLGVSYGGEVAGRVVDRAGRAVPHAIVRARGGDVRPALGTDVAESDADGAFVLRLPEGHYQLDASHARFAGVELDTPAVIVDGASHQDVTVVLAAGCIISGRVVRGDGSPAGDGAIEKQFGDTDTEFGPAGRVEADGTFRWTSVDDVDVALRAWPWKSSPSPARRFECRDGVRVSDVVFKIADHHADIAGSIVDANGQPVQLAYLDIRPLDPGHPGQQERGDADGHWQVFDMPPGRYHITVSVPGRGIADETITAPRDDVRLQLGGTGRIEGTTTDLVDGSFEATFEACDGVDLTLAHEPRIVSVTGGRFTIDDAPACDLAFAASWRHQMITAHADVSAGGTTVVELALGPARAKRIHGTVRDHDGRIVAGAHVAASVDGGVSVSTQADDAGRYEIDSVSGAHLFATDGHQVGDGLVGHANIPDEQVDIVVDHVDVEM